MLEFDYIKEDTDLFQIVQRVYKCCHGTSNFQGNSAEEFTLRMVKKGVIINGTTRKTNLVCYPEKRGKTYLTPSTVRAILFKQAEFLFFQDRKVVLKI